MADPFTVLGLPANASREEIRAAWRALVKTLHPDRLGADLALGAGAERRLSEVNAAYNSLVDRLGAMDEGLPPRAPGGAVGAFRPMTFEALTVAAADVGDITDADAPHSLVVHVDGPPTGFCRLDLVPDAGGSMVLANSDEVNPEWVCRALVAALVRLGVDAVAMETG